MELCDLPCGMSARVVEVRLGRDTARRLEVLGIYAGARVTLLKATPFRRTFLIGTAYSRVVLARAAARGVICA